MYIHSQRVENLHEQGIRGRPANDSFFRQATGGSLQLGRGDKSITIGIYYTGQTRRREWLDPKVVKLYKGKEPTSHMENFIQCECERSEPISDVTRTSARSAPATCPTSCCYGPATCDETRRLRTSWAIPRPARCAAGSNGNPIRSRRSRCWPAPGGARPGYRARTTCGSSAGGRQTERPAGKASWTGTSVSTSYSPGAVRRTHT